MPQVRFQGHRWRWFAIIVVSLCVVGWLVGLPGWWVRQAAMKSLARRDYGVAWDHALWASRLDQNNPESEFLIARLERKRGNLDQVRRHLQRAMTLGLDPERAHREELLVLAQAGAISEVVKDLDQLLINHSDDGAEICDAYVNGLLVNGQIDEAKLMIQQWQIAFPSDPQPDNLLGRLAEFYHKTTEAEGHYRHALTKNPQHFPSAYGLGRTLIELNRWQDALEAFRVCLSLPVKAPAQLGMGRCLANIGQDEQAAKLLHAAAEIPRDKLIEALKQLGEPTECDTLSFELGLLESKLGNSAEAVHWFQRAVDNNPQYREARYQLAMSLKGAGRDAEAQIHLDWRAGIQAKLGEIDRLYDAVKSDPNNLDARFRLGLLEREVGSEQSGQFWLRSVLARDPSHSGAKDALDQRP